jgi:hypothetical protein
MVKAIVEAIGATNDNGVTEAVVAVIITSYTLPFNIHHRSRKRGSNIQLAASIAVGIQFMIFWNHIQTIMSIYRAVTTIHTDAIASIYKVYLLTSTPIVLRECGQASPRIHRVECPSIAMEYKRDKQKTKHESLVPKIANTHSKYLLSGIEFSRFYA